MHFASTLFLGLGLLASSARVKIHQEKLVNIERAKLTKVPTEITKQMVLQAAPGELCSFLCEEWPAPPGRQTPKNGCNVIEKYRCKFDNPKKCKGLVKAAEKYCKKSCEGLFRDGSYKHGNCGKAKLEEIEAKDIEVPMEAITHEEQFENTDIDVPKIITKDEEEEEDFCEDMCATVAGKCSFFPPFEYTKVTDEEGEKKCNACGPNCEGEEEVEVVEAKDIDVPTAVIKDEDEEEDFCQEVCAPVPGKCSFFPPFGYTKVTDEEGEKKCNACGPSCQGDELEVIEAKDIDVPAELNQDVQLEVKDTEPKVPTKITKKMVLEAAPGELCSSLCEEWPAPPGSQTPKNGCEVIEEYRCKFDNPKKCKGLVKAAEKYCKNSCEGLFRNGSYKYGDCTTAPK